MIVECALCGGDGILNEVSCSLCNGDGEIDFGEEAFCYIKGRHKELIRGQVWGNIVRPDGVFRSYEVLECLDVTEFNALTDTKKQGTRDILSCGLVDLNDGKAGKVRLWNWFGAESTTVANLTTLIT